MTVTPQVAELPLDGIRGIAVIMVMGYHLWQAGFLKSLLFQPVVRIPVFNQTDLDLLFVLSGLFITRILLCLSTQATYFTTFYARRAFRIFPMHYVALKRHF